jgi:hypothetical protein
MNLSRRNVLTATASVGALPIFGCASLPRIIADSLLPPVPPYPFESPGSVNAEAKQISDRLAVFIDRWLNGDGPAEIPAELVPPGADPLPGHTNPFRVGAERQAKWRDYRVQLDMVQGYGPSVERAYRPPHFRPHGNIRKGSGIVYQGPLGRPEYKLGHGRGLWDFGAVWLRYYAPDNGRGPLAGVPLPRLSYETADGRRFGMIADIKAKSDDTNRGSPIRRSDPVELKWELPGPPIQWSRELDILQGSEAQRNRKPT